MKNLKESDAAKAQEEQAKAFDSLMTGILAIAYIVPLAVLGFYYYNFHQLGLSNDTSIWGEFGDFFGGTANPIFSFLTVVLLLLTVSLQSKQLKLSKSELEQTRQELQKAAEAQYESQKALNQQAQIASKAAKLNTISFLLGKYSDDMETLKNLNAFGAAAQTRNNSLEKLNEKRLDLEEMVEQIFNELIVIESFDNRYIPSVTS